MRAALEFGKQSPFPGLEDSTPTSTPTRREGDTDVGMMTMNYSEALAEALKLEMRRDPNIYIAGEDVGKFGGSFGVTGYGVFTEFPERVLDTPISETAIVGTRWERLRRACGRGGDPLHGLPPHLHGRTHQPGGQVPLHVRRTDEAAPWWSGPPWAPAWAPPPTTRSRWRPCSATPPA